MAGTPESRYTTALLEALTIEDALYHGTDLLSHCAGWVQPPARSGEGTGDGHRVGIPPVGEFVQESTAGHRKAPAGPEHPG